MFKFRKIQQPTQSRSLQQRIMLLKISLYCTLNYETQLAAALKWLAWLK